MAKKFFLALFILVLLVAFGLFLIGNHNSVDVYIDGENVSVETHSLNDVDLDRFNGEVCDLTENMMDDTKSNASTLRNDIENLCDEYGLKDPDITIDSTLGENQIPVLVHVEGTSMLPTLQDGQSVLLNKTHNVHVGDIVVAESDEYGGIIKRVADIRGDSVYLVSDNKNISYEYVNGVLYEIMGIRTWVNVNDINGVVIDY